MPIYQRKISHKVKNFSSFFRSLFTYFFFRQNKTRIFYLIIDQKKHLYLIVYYIAFRHCHFIRQAFSQFVKYFYWNFFFVPHFFLLAGDFFFLFLTKSLTIMLMKFRTSKGSKFVMFIAHIKKLYANFQK